MGVIGVGIIGKSHLNEYAKRDDVEIVAIADINALERERVADQFGIPNTYRSFRDLLAREDIVAVDVCLHNNLHAPVTIAALEAGKHVFCEKPMAGAYADALQMRDTACIVGKMLHIQLNTLYTKETRIAKRLLDEGHLGRPYHARSLGFRRRGRPFVDGYATPEFVNRHYSGGGTLFDMGVYHIAQILYLLGLPKIERVTGRVYQETQMDAGRRESSGYNVEEFATGYVRCADGLTLDILEAWAAQTGGFEGSYILGAQGGVRLEPLSFHTTLSDMEVNATFEAGSIDWRWHQLNPELKAYDSPQAHWVAALQGHVPLMPTAEIALETMLISEGIYLSHQLGREVTIEEIKAQAHSSAISPDAP
jgi:predicted dehydrogenase